MLKMAGQVVGEDELLDLTNKGYPEDASKGKKRIIIVYNKEEDELFYRQTATKHKVCKSKLHSIT